ncbi:MAG: acriflavin resistance protein, partial [Tardiphaga sp.]|nr:acriflavin resistance protein [Tardiphaga sp.]
ILHPVAVTIFGGLITATLLDAVLTPILFLKFGQSTVDRMREQTLRPAASHAPAPAY